MLQQRKLQTEKPQEPVEFEGASILSFIVGLVTTIWSLAFFWHLIPEEDVWWDVAAYITSIFAAVGTGVIVGVFTYVLFVRIVKELFGSRRSGNLRVVTKVDFNKGDIDERND